MAIQPYLFFNGRCEEAIGFYRQAIGAETKMLMRFQESPDPHPPGMLPPDWGSKVMHAEIRVGDASLLVSDGHTPGEPSFQGFTLALTVADAAEADRKFAGLSDGGQVRMPLGKTFFSPRFGMLADRFGVGWIIMVRSSKQ